MSGRLANASSPYLRQHADNPVDWHPWGEEALQTARDQDKPIFLSVGYSSCHWCHVMAHESFEDDAVAAALNEHFISIKLDREERPDIDEVYMTATQIALGHGGWPMSVFLTPDLKPFFAGTYFPRESQGEHPGFLTIVNSLGTSWTEKRSEIEETAEQFREALAKALNRPGPVSQLGASVDLIDGAVQAMHEAFDYEHGGFHGAPKFPPHAALRWLLDFGQKRRSLPTDPGSDDFPNQATWMATRTLEQMALGGIHDHVGGGFHRYTVDEIWRLPHFEKMLYDNALLLGAYSRAATMTEGDQKHLFETTANGIVNWAKETMLTKDGLFQSALDADTEGVEGATYLWSHAEIEEILGDTAPEFIEAFQCEPGGNVLDEATHQPLGLNVLHQSQFGFWQTELDKLKAVRDQRVQPGLDDKAICAWNGLMIEGLAVAGEVELAAACADAWIGHHGEDGLPHQIAQGKASGPAFLDDYAFLIEGLCALHQATNEQRWQDHANQLADEMLRRFKDESSGAFWYSANDAEEVISRTRPVLDQALPSASGSAARALLLCGRLEEAGTALSALIGWAENAPHSAQTHLDVLTLMLTHLGVEKIEFDHVDAFDEEQVQVIVTPKQLTADKDGWGHALVTIGLPEGIHINSSRPSAAWLMPTQLQVNGVLGEAGFPDAEDDIYTGDVQIPVRLRAKAEPSEFELTVSCQPCTDNACFAPITRVVKGLISPQE